MQYMLQLLIMAKVSNLDLHWLVFFDSYKKQKCNFLTKCLCFTLLTRTQNQILGQVPVRCSELEKFIAATCAKATVQGCIGGESVATCGYLTNSGFRFTIWAVLTTSQPQ